MRTVGLAVAAVALIWSGATLAKPMHKTAPAAAFQLNSTSWEFSGDDGAKMQESIGPDGKYVTHSLGKHVDHGTAVMKGDKACFTSAMTNDGELCWTTKAVAVGAILPSVNDKGEKLDIKRVKYTPPKM